MSSSGLFTLVPLGVSCSLVFRQVAFASEDWTGPPHVAGFSSPEAPRTLMDLTTLLVSPRLDSFRPQQPSAGPQLTWIIWT